jgi:hypothetical protein
MPEPVAVLVMAAATTFVAAMATSAWQDIRTGIVHLFRRTAQTQQTAIAAQLDGHAVLVTEAKDPERVRQGLVPAWQFQIEALLREDPGSEEDLRVLVERAGLLLPPVQRTWVQTNVARDGGQVFAAQGGSVIVHQAQPGHAQPPGVSTAGEDTRRLP